MKIGIVGSRAALLTLLIALLPGSAAARAASENDGYLTVGAVQFAVSTEVYRSAESFEAAVRQSLSRMEAEAEDRGVFPDLAVFPEYTSAFLGLSVLDDDDLKVLASGGTEARAIIDEALAATHQDMVGIWKTISAEKSYAILAGTHLNPDSDGRLRNRALLYSGGDILWTQDKVFPGAPEQRLLNLASGRLEDAEAFELDGFMIVTTICRDTYSEEWETVLPEADLWIDIKANELPYTMEYYDGALTSRLPNSPIDRGLTVSLSGSILGFSFSGPTEYLHDEGPIAGTDPWAENAILVISLPSGR